MAQKLQWKLCSTCLRAKTAVILDGEREWIWTQGTLNTQRISQHPAPIKKNNISWQNLSLSLRNEVVKALQNPLRKCRKQIPPPAERGAPAAHFARCCREPAIQEDFCAVSNLDASIATIRGNVEASNDTLGFSRERFPPPQPSLGNEYWDVQF